MNDDLSIYLYIRFNNTGTHITANNPSNYYKCAYQMDTREAIKIPATDTHKS